MRFIPLTNSRFSTIVDDEDYDRVMALNTNWYVEKKWNKPTGIRSTNRKKILLHRFILNLPSGSMIDIDHKFQDIFDNRKEFIRVCNAQQNCFNRSTDWFKGVHHKLDQPNRPYRAIIEKDGIQYYLGSYKTPEEAARAYDKKAIELFGEFAFLNFKII